MLGDAPLCPRAAGCWDGPGHVPTPQGAGRVTSPPGSGPDSWLLSQLQQPCWDVSHPTQTLAFWHGLGKSLHGSSAPAGPSLRQGWAQHVSSGDSRLSLSWTHACMARAWKHAGKIWNLLRFFEKWCSQNPCYGCTDCCAQWSVPRAPLSHKGGLPYVAPQILAPVSIPRMAVC